MGKQEKTTAIIGLITVIAVCLVIMAVSINYIINNEGFSFGETETPDTAAITYLSGLNNYAVFTDGSRLYIEDMPKSEQGQFFYNLFKGKMNYTAETASSEKKSAAVSVNITCPDISDIATLIHGHMETYLCEKAENAQLKSELYNDDGTYLQSAIDDAYLYGLTNLDAELKTMTVNSELHLTKNRKVWEINNEAAIDNSLDTIAEQIKTTACTSLTVWPITYVIEETALKGSVPDENGWCITDNPQDIAAVLSTDKAKALIGDQTMCWNPDIEFAEGKKIRCYLDETILMIQWQETEARTMGTFCEIIIADGSQLRRKIAGDTFGDMNFETTTEFAKDTNAVLAVGGDFYNHGRNCGIVVYNRTIYRFDPLTCDDCYITTDGDILFSYRNQFSTVEEAQQFVDENDILYSLCFGPVLVDNGVDVTPDVYPWGEISDTYARSCLGMLGEHHYLTMNLNCELPSHWYLATLRSAADAMIKRGCIKAYALDGGQTATTAVNYELINPVQFGTQRYISDIIYFCSAVPEA